MSKRPVRWNGKWLLPGLLLAVSACSSVGPATNECVWVKPIYVSKADVLTEGTVEQILRHNETWERVCK